MNRSQKFYPDGPIWLSPYTNRGGIYGPQPFGVPVGQQQSTQLNPLLQNPDSQHVNYRPEPRGLEKMQQMYQNQQQSGSIGGLPNLLSSGFAG